MKPPEARRCVTKTVALVGALTIALVGWLEHAEWLIGTAYPDMLKAGHQRAAETAILSWLATVESTQIPDRIQDTLRKLDKLPYPETARKRELVGLLVKDGYEQLAAPRP